VLTLSAIKAAAEVLGSLQSPIPSGFTSSLIRAIIGREPAQKITLGEMRASGVRGLLIFLRRLLLQSFDRSQ
jgi:hypothetical protein